MPRPALVDNVITDVGVGAAPQVLTPKIRKGAGTTELQEPCTLTIEELEVAVLEPEPADHPLGDGNRVLLDHADVLEPQRVDEGSIGGAGTDAELARACPVGFAAILRRLELGEADEPGSVPWVIPRVEVEVV